MRRIERIGELDRPIQQGADGERPPADATIEWIALEQLHGDELGALVLVDLVDRTDARMVQRRRGSSLAHEALDHLSVVGAIRREELERHVARELEVFGLVDDAHAAGAERSNNSIMRNSRADHRY